MICKTRGRHHKLTPLTHDQVLALNTEVNFEHFLGSNKKHLQGLEMEGESSVGRKVLLAVAALHPVVREGDSTDRTEETPQLGQCCASSLLHLCSVVFHKAGGVCQDGATHAAHKLAGHLQDEDEEVGE